MRWVAPSILATVFGLASGIAAEAKADVLIRVSKAEQTMWVYVDGRHRYTFDVSTARRGYTTPTGSYRPTTLSRFHRSSIYNNAPMPYSIFFHRGYAIHGSYSVRDLGNPASHGCIRLHPEDARDLFELVQEYGADDTRIVISY
jgi:lipoprotein-anchoring transpeptidase ErfK/SrfK